MSGVIVALAGAGGAVAKSVAPGDWELLEPPSSGSPGRTADPAVFRDHNAILHVAWVHANSALSDSLREDVFAVDGSRPAAPTTIVSDWVHLSDGSFAEAPNPNPALLFFFGGQQTADSGTPLGTMVTEKSAAWSAPAQIDPNYGSVAAWTSVQGATWYVATESLSRPALLTAPAGSLSGVGWTRTYLTSGVPGVTEAAPNVVNDGSGVAATAWCAFGDGTGGVYTQLFEDSTMLGPPIKLPGSTTTFSGKPHSTCVLQSTVGRHTPLVNRSGGDDYVVGAAGYPTLTRVLVWKLGYSDGPARTFTVASANRPHTEPVVVADPAGRLWVGWIETLRSGASVFVVRRSNLGATVFGAPVTVKSPAGWTLGSVEGSASAQRLDVVGQFSSSSRNALEHTVVLPGLALQIVAVIRPGKGRRIITYRVLDAGDPVAGAIVTTRRVSGRTNARGLVTLKVTGTVAAVATKAGYTHARL